MRVLHIGKFFPPFAGGIEHFLADLLPALEEQGARTAALVHHHRPFARPPSAGNAGPPTPAVYRVPCYGQLLYAPISPTFPVWLARVIGSFRPAVLHLHMPNTSAFWALTIPAARRIPWVIHWHADVVPSRIDRRLALAYRAYRPLEQRLLAASQAIIATSPPYLASSRPLEPWQHKCRVIPLGLNPERLIEPGRDALARAEQGWGQGACRILAVGRLTYYKGHEVLIRALAQLPGARLVMVGRGEQQSRLATLIDALGIEERITLAGFQSEADLNAWFATCDVLCLPSLERTEAFGMVLLEAMRFAKPVIASAVPGSGVGWVVREGGHGLLVEPDDPDTLAAALMQLARSPQQRLTLGRSGALALQRTFHISRVAEQTLALYRTFEQPAR